MEVRHVPVLIVGGGPVGLALAGDLGWRGVAMRADRAGRRLDRHAEDERGQRPHAWSSAAAGALPSRCTTARFPATGRSTSCSSPASPATSSAGCGGRRATRPRPTTPAGAAAGLLADVVRPDPARFREVVSERDAALSHQARIVRGSAATRVVADITDLESGARTRVERGLPGGLRRRQQHGAPGARHRADRQGRARPSAATCTSARRTCSRPAAGSAARSSSASTATGCGRTSGSSIPPMGCGGSWRFDSGGTQRRRGRPRRAGAPRGGQADRCRIRGLEHLDTAQRGGRTLQQGPRAAGGRCRASAFADRRARHEYRPRRCGRSRLEARRHRAGLGRAGTAGELRRRAAAGRPPQRRHDHAVFSGARTVRRRAWRDRRRRRRGRAPARRARRRARQQGRRHVPDRRLAARLPLRGVADLRARRHAGAARPSPTTSCPPRGPGARAPHLWLARRPFDPRPVRTRLHAAAARRRCGGRFPRSRPRRPPTASHSRSQRWTRPRRANFTRASWRWSAPTAMSRGAATICPATPARSSTARAAPRVAA